MHRPDHRRWAALVAAGLVLATVGGACARTVPGRAGAAPSAVSVPAPRQLGPDEIGMAAATALQELWRREFPAAFGRPWTDITTFVPAQTADADAAVPPCVGDETDLVGQAFYCPAADAVVWDDDGLLPDLRNRFGPAGVVVVLAHEVGHAVQTRLGVDRAQAAAPEQYPTILLETMADCYAGAALASLAERPVPGLPVSPLERDDALLALVGFRDPLGLEPGDASAHGNAFDRVSAFQDGHVDGPPRCADMTLQNRAFTQRRFGSAADRARGGDLPLSTLLPAVEADARRWFGALAPGWRPPPLDVRGACPEPVSAQGPAGYCAADGAVVVEQDDLAVLHQQFGDYAAATLVVSRYGIAALAARGMDPAGPPAGAAVVCLAGAYTGRLLDPADGFSLSPGDLDEAVQVLLAGDWAGRDAAGAVDPGQQGFDRVGLFRTGLLGGPGSCLPAR